MHQDLFYQERLDSIKSSLSIEKNLFEEQSKLYQSEIEKLMDFVNPLISQILSNKSDIFSEFFSTNIMSETISNFDMDKEPLENNHQTIQEQIALIYEKVDKLEQNSLSIPQMILITIFLNISMFYLQQFLPTIQPLQSLSYSHSKNINNTDNKINSHKRYVTAKVLNVRKNASIKSKIIGKLYNKQVITVLKKNRNWCFINFKDNKSGYKIEG